MYYGAIQHHCLCSHTNCLFDQYEFKCVYFHCRLMQFASVSDTCYISAGIAVSYSLLVLVIHTKCLCVLGVSKNMSVCIVESYNMCLYCGFIKLVCSEGSYKCLCASYNMIILKIDCCETMVFYTITCIILIKC